ncbi:hypothetical protein LTR08_002203 [Meristemomyces frigidus]|nr:hypothetical protein LTR08_002203 [Meristemomyces frigidus]
MSRPTTRPLRTAHTPPPPPKPKPNPPLLTYSYTPHPPTPLNLATLGPTRDFAADSSHPFHLRTVRRLAQFDPSRLHWRVHCPVDVSSGKGFLRAWAARRVRNALRARLGEAGGQGNGGGETGRGGKGGVGALGKEVLGGALLVVLSKSSIALTATGEEVRESVGRVVEGMLRQQRGQGGRKPWRSDGGGRSAFEARDTASSASSSSPPSSSRPRHSSTHPRPPPPLQRTPAKLSLTPRPKPRTPVSQTEPSAPPANAPHDAHPPRPATTPLTTPNPPVPLPRPCSLNRTRAVPEASVAVREALGQGASGSVEGARMGKRGRQGGARAKLKLGRQAEE